MRFLAPDKHTLTLKYYHMLNKALIPTMLGSYFNHAYNMNSSSIDVANALNFGFHSYVSTSAVISDYIKHPKISTIARVSSMNLHLLSTIGIIGYIVV